MASSRNIDLHLLECFDLLMRERSVSRAAEHLGVSQSSASEMLARLRERFGDPLFVRTRDGLAPTTRAEELLPVVRAAAESLRQLLETGSAFDAATGRVSFRLTTSDYTQLLLMPSLMRIMLAEAPHCTIDILPVNILRIEQALDAGDIDLAIAYYPEPPASLRRSPLFSDRHVCVARPGHRCTLAPLTAEAFAALSHVRVAPSGLTYFSSVVDQALQACGLQRRVAVSSPHFLLAAQLVSQTDLVLALPRQAALALAQHFPLQVIEIPIPMRTVELSMYWHERCHHSRPQQWLRERVRSVLMSSAASEGRAAA
jgi:DNA-binding transcriptional LysR family regulator